MWHKMAAEAISGLITSIHPGWCLLMLLLLFAQDTILGLIHSGEEGGISALDCQSCDWKESRSSTIDAQVKY